MNAYVFDFAWLCLLISGALNFVLIAYTYGKTFRSPIRDSFIFATSVNGAYLMSGGISESLAAKDPSGHQVFIFGFDFWSHLCWFNVFILPIVFINFYYILANRKYDPPFQMVGILCVLTAVTSLFNDKLLLGGEWNTPVTAFIIVPCLLYGGVVCFQTWWRSKTKTALIRNGLVLLTVFIPVGMFLIFDLLLDRVLGLLPMSAFYITATYGIVNPLLMGIAITKYGILKIDLSYAAEGLFMNAEDPVLLIRPDQTIVRANPTAQKLFHIAGTFKEGTGVVVTDLIPQFDNSKQKFSSTILLDAEKRIYSCSNSTVTAGSEVRGKILLLRDVTKEIELNSMKTEFTSTVSHELRTPLTSILGFARIIEKRLSEVILPKMKVDTKKESRSVKQVQRNLNVIVSEGQRLTQLINDVLDISKMEAGKLEWRFQRVQLTDILNAVIAERRAQIADKNLLLQLQIDSEIPEIIADPYRIEQVFNNVLDNSVKFTYSGRIQVFASVVGKTVQIQFKDTGIGIEEQDRDKIFQKYQQVGDVLTDKPTGTGLGLPISKEIIDRHGGKIAVKSIHEVGSLFQINFPLPVSERRNVDAVPFSTIIEQWSRIDDRIINLRENAILIVDDESSVRESLRKAIEPAGFTVIEAKNGVEGIDYIQNTKPSLVILDVMMPKLNGFEVVNILKNDPKTMNLPIIMLTVVDEIERGYGLGVDLYLKKPVEGTQIVESINRVLTRREGPQTTFLLGNPGHEVAFLQKRLENFGQNVVVVENIDTLYTKLQTEPPDMLLVEAERFSGEAVYAALNKVASNTSVLVKFVSKE